MFVVLSVTGREGMPGADIHQRYSASAGGQSENRSRLFQSEWSKLRLTLRFQTDSLIHKEKNVDLKGSSRNISPNRINLYIYIIYNICIIYNIHNIYIIIYM